MSEPFSFLVFPPAGRKFTPEAAAEFVGREVDLGSSQATVLHAEVEREGYAVRLTIHDRPELDSDDLADLGYQLASANVSSLARKREERAGAPGWKGRNHGKRRRPRR